MQKQKTPIQIQYLSIKENHEDKILLFRMGDFYEVFNQDALITSKILNIALTKRYGEPMCGFPHHALDQYAYKLVEAGQKVAICDQVGEAPKKGIVRREVVSILTKGTWAENPLLDRSINSFLSVVFYEKGRLSLIFSDLSTGEIILRSVNSDQPLGFLLDELTRYMPVETLCEESITAQFPIKEELSIKQDSIRFLPKTFFTDTDLYRSYCASHSVDLQESDTLALKGLFAYLEENHYNKESIQHLRPITTYEHMDTLFMNESTLKHLELVYNAKDFSTKGTLFSVLNHTKTMPAARKLRRMLVAPSAKCDEILRQQERTEYFYHLSSSAHGLTTLLKGMGDLERLTARLATGKILPRECLALAESIEKAEQSRDFLLSAKPFIEYIAALKPCAHMVNTINKMIEPECSNTLDGNVILRGIDAELDDLKEILNDSKNILIKLQAEERIKTGINTLKISYNKIYGYYIEIGKGSLKNIPENYVRKQSLVNAERFTIPELIDFEQKITTAEESVIRLEHEVYQKLITDLQKYYSDLLPLSEFVSEVDLRAALAQVAKNNRYTKSTISNKFEWDIKEGRHPVVEKLLLQTDIFVANDTYMDAKNSRILIVTGPNMAGKSTYLRQNALFAVMNQIGSYIPADSAHIGIVDKIFTRIGATDDLSSGRSTFYMEMEEAAHVVSEATERSLIIMDELGRGTSTLDGLALAWAILEHFQNHPSKKAKLLFSTHYHELTALAEYSGVKNLCMAIQENQGKPVFLRKVIEGEASKSYGIHVAEMAGMNPEIVSRANTILIELEQGSFLKKNKNISIKETICESKSLLEIPDKDTEIKNKIYEKLKTVDPNTLTPLNALQILFELRNLC